MVIRVFLLSLVSLFLQGCDIDILGVFASSDLDDRLKYRNTFRFILPEERSLLLAGSSYSFIVLTDTHIENGNAFGLDRLREVVASDPAVRFVAVLGDITQNGRAEDLETFINTVRSFQVPCYPVIGNHDIYHNNWPVWRDLVGSTSYKIEIETGGNRDALLILDSANAFFGSSQIGWLDAELEAARGRVFVFTHTNLFTESITDLQTITDLRERARILSVLEGRCAALFTGHAHKRISKTLGGVKYLTLEDFKSTGTYCSVTVTPAGIGYTFYHL
ncbi:MAG: metallophosphoesterase [Spirochaetaceae bacterium]|jgi:predicted phosphodiesterase|nr:metallophosphoesterase [Spirochaetaceae bacterium]